MSMVLSAGISLGLNADDAKVYSNLLRMKRCEQFSTGIIFSHIVDWDGGPRCFEAEVDSQYHQENVY